MNANCASRRFFYTLASSLLLVLVVACGGAGGSGGGTTTVDTGCYPLTQTTGTDPLKDYQWHLKNNGGIASSYYFASNLPSAGNHYDLNLPSGWSSLSGQNINVTVVDTGMEVRHEDLANNVVCRGSYNFLTGTNNPTNTTTTGDHGTAVAGLIAAVGNNNIGITGIAPKANLRAYNVLQSQTYTNYGISFGGNTSYGATSSDIFNFSAGTDSASLYAPDSTFDATFGNVTSLRSGKGAVLVKSAGNGYFGMTSSSGSTIGTTSYCLSSNVTCQNVNQDSDNTLYSTLVVAAVDADSKSSSYSSSGSAIWVSGFGGEYGYDTAVNGTYSASSTYNKPAIVTADQSGCGAGYVRSGVASKNLLNKGDGTATLNTSCNYTATFNGTSAAAPTVSGVIALMLAANPNLTWRDVRHILAKTARKVQPGQSTITTTAYFGGSLFTLEQGWVTNAAGAGVGNDTNGFAFHNYFGFGLVDASAAVTAAGSYTAGSLGTFKSYNVSATPGNTAAMTIPANSTTGLTINITMPASGTSGITTVEQAELTFYVGSGYLPYCNQIELTSPSGTKSIVFNMDSGHTSAATGGIRLLSNAFYGETAAGTWAIKVINRTGTGCSAAQVLSTSTGQKLTIRGR